MRRIFPEWFFTRVTGYALLLMCIVTTLFEYDQTQKLRFMIVMLPLLLASAVTTLVLLSILWLREFDEPHDYEEWRPARWLGYAVMTLGAWGFWSAAHGSMRWLSLGAVVGFGWITVMMARRSVPKPGERLRGEPLHQAYLVMTINIAEQPPVARRAAVFSHRGSTLTSITDRELNVDVHHATGDSYEEAETRLLRDVELYWPKLMPFIHASYPRSKARTTS